MALTAAYIRNKKPSFLTTFASDKYGFAIIADDMAIDEQIIGAIAVNLNGTWFFCFQHCDDIIGDTIFVSSDLSRESVCQPLGLYNLGKASLAIVCQARGLSSVL